MPFLCWLTYSNSSNYRINTDWFLTEDTLDFDAIDYLWKWSTCEFSRTSFFLFFFSMWMVIFLLFSLVEQSFGWTQIVFLSYHVNRPRTIPMGNGRDAQFSKDLTGALIWFSSSSCTSMSNRRSIKRFRLKCRETRRIWWIN